MDLPQPEADHGDHFIAADIQRNVGDRLLFAVIHIDVAGGHLGIAGERLANGLVIGSLRVVPDIQWALCVPNAGGVRFCCTRSSIPCCQRRRVLQRQQPASYMQAVCFFQSAGADKPPAHSSGSKAHQHHDRSAEVFSVNPRSGLSAHRKICTGNTVDGSVTPQGIHDKRHHAYHQQRGRLPSACAMPIMEPVRIPGMATGNTWWLRSAAGRPPTSAAWRIEATPPGSRPGK